jgi:hypothetical protein
MHPYQKRRVRELQKILNELKDTIPEPHQDIFKRNIERVYVHDEYFFFQDIEIILKHEQVYNAERIQQLKEQYKKKFPVLLHDSTHKRNYIKNHLRTHGLNGAIRQYLLKSKEMRYLSKKNHTDIDQIDFNVLSDKCILKMIKRL